MLCRHCARAKVNRPLGLCWRCYYTPGLREHYGGRTVAKRKPEKVVCVFFDQVNDHDPGAWCVADELHQPDGTVSHSEMIEGAGFGNDRDAAVKFATERAKATGATLVTHDK